MSIEISLIIPCSGSIDELRSAAIDSHDFFRNKFNLGYEIILVPNGQLRDLVKSKSKSKSKLFSDLDELKVCLDCVYQGKGAAIRQGFEMAQGKYIYYTDSDLPYDLSFIIDSYEMLKNKQADLITGNRRLAESWFNVPTHQLHFVYRRHCFGLLFNFVVRKIFSIRSTDTQAGIKGMTRELAEIFFKKLSCYGFLFDLELHLTAAENKFRKLSLPVHFQLFHEKSTVRIFKELFTSAFWLVKLKYLQSKGHYLAAEKNVSASPFPTLIPDPHGI